MVGRDRSSECRTTNLFTSSQVSFNQYPREEEDYNENEAIADDLNDDEEESRENVFFKGRRCRRRSSP